MKNMIILFLAATLCLFSVEYETKKIEDHYCQPIKSGKNFCMDYKIEYPIAYGLEEQVRANINSAIQGHIPTHNAHKYVVDYIKEVGGEIFMGEHTDTTEIKILSLTERTFSLDIFNSSYLGGAHGMHGSQAYNYDRQSGRLLTLGDMFIPDSRESLRAIAEKSYREQNGLTASDDLRTTQDWFENKFILPKSIGIGADGLQLVYNPYEIKPYAYGMTSLTVPYYLLASIVKPDSLLTPLIKHSIASRQSGLIAKSFDQADGATIDFKVRVLSHKKVQIDVDVTNLTQHRMGGLSLSFPQLKYRDIIIHKEQRGFNKIQLYSAGSRLYYAPTKKTIRSQYLLAEASTKEWYKNQTKSISLLLDVPRDIGDLQINIRTTFTENKYITTIPYSGVKGQQGFSNYRIIVAMKL